MISSESERAGSFIRWNLFCALFLLVEWNRLERINFLKPGGLVSEKHRPRAREMFFLGCMWREVEVAHRT